MEGLQPLGRGVPARRARCRSRSPTTSSCTSSSTCRTRRRCCTRRRSARSSPATSPSDVANDTLPQVSWIIPPLGYDEHPPSPPAAGMWFTHQVLSALVANPKTWSKTVLFIMYDENDGFFDHVTPPVAAAGHTGGVPDRRSPAVARRRCRRAPRPRLPGPAPGGVAVQPRRLRVLGHLRPHLAAAVPRDPLRREGAQHLGVAAQRHRRPDLDAACRLTRHLGSRPAGHAGEKRRQGQERMPGPQLIEFDLEHPAPYPVPTDQAMPTQEPGTAVPVPT